MPMTVVLVLVGASVALLVLLSVLGWLMRPCGAALRTTVAVSVLGVGTLGLLAAGLGPIGAPRTVAYGLLAQLFAVAVLGGGPVTTAVLGLVDRQERGRSHPPSPAGVQGQERSEVEEVLRGGAWIGVFERSAVFATLVAGWPEGLAVVLALKGLGRYSELRADAGSHGAVAERFLIGTFASMLWAVACAGVAVALRR